MEDPQRRIARRCEGVLPALLHAQQPVAGHRRRLRSRRRPRSWSRSTSAVFRPAPRSIVRRAGCRPSSSERIVEVADRVPQERTYMVWPAPEYFASRRCRVEPGLDGDDRWSVVASEQGARLRQAAVHGGQLVHARRRDRRRVRRRRHGASRSRRSPMSSGSSARRLASWPRRDRPQPSSSARRRSRSSSFVSGLERIGGFGGKADLLNQYNVYLGDPGKFEADLARHRSLTIGRCARTRSIAG